MHTLAVVKCGCAHHELEVPPVQLTPALLAKLFICTALVMAGGVVHARPALLHVVSHESVLSAPRNHWGSAVAVAEGSDPAETVAVPDLVAVRAGVPVPLLLEVLEVVRTIIC